MRPPTAELEHQNSTVLTPDERRTLYGPYTPTGSTGRDGQAGLMEGATFGLARLGRRRSPGGDPAPQG
ncbi:hypothetical protein [Streptomyces sp. NPDC057623]|uniref:hypothetical protein n=1 Tax=Streptomyces sp. NPDC057623 TaxID=3346187 RepID=UPI0036BEB0F0